MARPVSGACRAWSGAACLPSGSARASVRGSASRGGTRHRCRGLWVEATSSIARFPCAPQWRLPGQRVGHGVRQALAALLPVQPVLRLGAGRLRAVAAVGGAIRWAVPAARCLTTWLAGVQHARRLRLPAGVHVSAHRCVHASCLSALHVPALHVPHRHATIHLQAVVGCCTPAPYCAGWPACWPPPPPPSGYTWCFGPPAAPPWGAWAWLRMPWLPTSRVQAGAAPLACS